MCIMVDLKIVNMQSVTGRVKLSGDFLSKFMTSRRSFFFRNHIHVCSGSVSEFPWRPYLLLLL